MEELRKLKVVVGIIGVVLLVAIVTLGSIAYNQNNEISELTAGDLPSTTLRTEEIKAPSESTDVPVTQIPETTQVESVSSRSIVSPTGFDDGGDFVYYNDDIVMSFFRRSVDGPRVPDSITVFACSTYQPGQEDDTIIAYEPGEATESNRLTPAWASITDSILFDYGDAIKYVILRTNGLRLSFSSEVADMTESTAGDISADIAQLIEGLEPCL